MNIYGLCIHFEKQNRQDSEKRQCFRHATSEQKGQHGGAT